MAHSFLYSRGSTHQRGRRCARKKISKLLEPGLFSALHGRAERQTRSWTFKDQRAGANAMRLLNKSMQTRSLSASLTAWFPRNDARREHSTKELNRAPLLLAAARYHFLTASTIGAGGVLCRIKCWFVRVG
jgi:hypothetical protein